MAAHLHRYGSELGWFEDIVSDISKHHEQFFKDVPSKSGDTRTLAGQRLSIGLVQIASQLKAVNTFRQELQHKTQNILALVSLTLPIIRCGLH
jgi:hypothetical protein